MSGALRCASRRARAGGTQIYAKTFTGPTFTLDVEGIACVRAKIQDKESTLPNQQRKNTLSRYKMEKEPIEKKEKKEEKDTTPPNLTTICEIVDRLHGCGGFLEDFWILETISPQFLSRVRCYCS